MSRVHWKVEEGKTHDHGLSVGDVPLYDDDPSWSAFVKFDGCVDLYEVGGDGIHICNLDEMIARLQDLRALAKEKFGPEWPEY